jgi:demethylspheroidene O-methyltransferase
MRLAGPRGVSLKASPGRAGGGSGLSVHETRRSWLDRLYLARDRLLASPGFQRWAAAFPLTRPVANAQARALFDMCAGFVYAQVLTACIRLKLFDALAEGARTPDDLAATFAMPPESMRRLLIAAAALGLLTERSGGRFGLGMLGAALRGNPGVAAMVEHHAMLYDDLRDPLALLRSGGGPATRLGAYWPYAVSTSPDSAAAEDVAGYTALMSASQHLIAEDILAAYDFRRHRQVLDIGGGDGAFLIAAAARAAGLRLALFDLPPVAAQAASRFAAHGIADRATAIGGNFLADSLPSGADLVTLIRILLDHDDAAVLNILRGARRAIAPGGLLLIAEPISGLSGSRAVTDAYFGLYLFAMGRGRSRSFSEIRALLHEAGFTRIRAVSTRRPLLTNLVTALSQNGK